MNVVSGISFENGFESMHVWKGKIKSWQFCEFFEDIVTEDEELMVHLD